MHGFSIFLGPKTFYFEVETWRSKKRKVLITILFRVEHKNAQKRKDNEQHKIGRSTSFNYELQYKIGFIQGWPSHRIVIVIIASRPVLQESHLVSGSETDTESDDA